MLLNQQDVDSMRVAAEQSLSFFARNILQLRWITSALHQSMCDDMQATEKRRILVLGLRGHAKTTLTHLRQEANASVATLVRNSVIRLL